MMVNNVLSWWRNICITPHQLNRRATQNDLLIIKLLRNEPQGWLWSYDRHNISGLPRDQYVRALKRLMKYGRVECERAVSLRVEESDLVRVILKELK